MTAATQAARRPIVVSGHLPAPSASVLQFLERLENHPRLAPGSAEMLYLRNGPEGGAHALVRLRGPLGIERMAGADLWETPAGSEYVAGRVRVGAGTEVSVTWMIEPDASGCFVTVTVSVVSADRRDGFLLRLGARAWLARQLRTSLERLSAELVPAGAQTNGDRSRLAVATAHW